MRIKSQIAGIPCLINVTSAEIVPPNPSCTDSDVDYHGYAETEWVVLDQRGRPAKWLERKLTDADEQRIDGEVLEAVKRQPAEYDA